VKSRFALAARRAAHASAQSAPTGFVLALTVPAGIRAAGAPMDRRVGAGYAASWTAEGASGEKTVTEARAILKYVSPPLLGIGLELTLDLHQLRCRRLRASRSSFFAVAPEQSRSKTAGRSKQEHCPEPIPSWNRLRTSSLSFSPSLSSQGLTCVRPRSSRTGRIRSSSLYRP
jgi:hypothetical protein